MQLPTPAGRDHGVLTGLVDDDHTQYLRGDGTRPFEEAAYYDEEYDNGNAGAAITIDWRNGNKQRVTLTAANCVVTFVDPPGVCNIVLRLLKDGVGVRGVTWPGDVDTGGGAGIIPSALGNYDYIGLYFYGTGYTAAGLLNCS